MSDNDHRRHMTASARATVAAKSANIKLGNIAAQKCDSPIGESKPLISREEPAKRLNVGTSSVDRARKVLADGKPQIIDALEKDQITVNAAYEER